MGYFRMSDNIIDMYGKKLGLAGLGLFAYLSRRADKSGISFPSINKIKKDLGVGSAATIRRYTKRIENLGLIKRWLVPGKEYSNYHYQILYRPPSQNERTLPQKVTTKEYTVKENTFKEKEFIKNKRDSYKGLMLNGMDKGSSFYEKFSMNKD